MEGVDFTYHEGIRPSPIAIPDYTPLLQIAKNTVISTLRGHSALVPRLAFPARGLQAVLVGLQCRRTSSILGRAFRLNQESHLLVQDVFQCANDALASAERKGRHSGIYLDSLHIDLWVFHHLETVADWTSLLELGNPGINESVNLDKLSPLFKVTKLSEIHL